MICFFGVTWNDDRIVVFFHLLSSLLLFWEYLSAITHHDTYVRANTFKCVPGNGTGRPAAAQRCARTSVGLRLDGGTGPIGVDHTTISCGETPFVCLFPEAECGIWAVTAGPHGAYTCTGWGAADETVNFWAASTLTKRTA